jgi:hypothetical protein
MIGYPRNHCFSNQSFRGLSVEQQQFDDDIYKIIESKYPKYEIKRLSSLKKREHVLLELVDTLSSLSKTESSWSWCIIASVHNLHPDGISLWFGSKQCMQRYRKD